MLKNWCFGYVDGQTQKCQTTYGGKEVLTALGKERVQI